MSLASAPLPFPGFTRLYTLGVGSSSCVCLAEDASSGARMAVKVVCARGRARSTSEAEVMHALDFPFVCRLFASGELDGRAYLALEHAAGGTLLELLARRGRLGERALAALAGQLQAALEYLHRIARIAHLDVKAENVLVDARGVVRLADFGLAGFADDERAACGSAPYAAPEAVAGGKPGAPADVWALGVVLFCCAAGRFPFYDPDPARLRDKIRRADPEYPRAMSPALRDLIARMLAKDEGDRISIAGVREHAFLAGFDFALLGALRALPRPQPAPGLPGLIRAREEEMLRYRPFAIVAETDETRAEQAALDRRLAGMRPLAGGARADPMRRLAVKVAAVRPRRGGS
jgi:serine/threonine protein kinase